MYKLLGNLCIASSFLSYIIIIMIKQYNFKNQSIYIYFEQFHIVFIIKFKIYFVNALCHSLYIYIYIYRN